VEFLVHKGEDHSLQPSPKVQTALKGENEIGAGLRESELQPSAPFTGFRAAVIVEGKYAHWGQCIGSCR
jgi:hypothetical protein